MTFGAGCNTKVKDAGIQPSAQQSVSSGESGRDKGCLSLEGFSKAGASYGRM